MAGRSAQRLLAILGRFFRRLTTEIGAPLFVYCNSVKPGVRLLCCSFYKKDVPRVLLVRAQVEVRRELTKLGSFSGYPRRCLPPRLARSPDPFLEQIYTWHSVLVQHTRAEQAVR